MTPISAPSAPTAWPMNAVTNNGLLASAIRREAVEQDVHEYSISLEQGEICNQKQSGRCWMFAALNTPALSGDEEAQSRDLRALAELPPLLG